MSGEILTTIITILTVVGFISAQTVMMIRGQEQLRKEFKEEFKEVRTEIKEVRGDIAVVNERLSAEIAAVDKRLSHTDGLVEGLSRALLSTQAPAQTQAQALA